MASNALQALFADARVTGTLRSSWDDEQILSVRDLANFYEDDAEVVAHLSEIDLNEGAVDKAVNAWRQARDIVEVGLPEDEGGAPRATTTTPCSVKVVNGRRKPGSMGHQRLRRASSART